MENSGATAEKSRGTAKQRQGVVIANKMNKTVVVAIKRLVKHTAYGKYVRKTKKFYVHDERSECGVGDVVRIVETRPLSKLKRWRVQEVLVKAQ